MNFKKEKLDFSKKGLLTFPTEVFEHKHLRKLILKNNLIKTIPPEIATLKYLETLDLTNNKINNLFAKIFELPRLKILILDYNQLRNIPKQIKNLKSLKIFSISNNRIGSFPEEMIELNNLEELNISENAFTSFPKEILALKKLKSLWLSKNHFEEFPVNEIVNNLDLKRLYCYSYYLESNEKINPTFLELSRISGNSLSNLQSTNQKNEKVVGQGLVIDDSIINRSMIKSRNKTKIFLSYSHQDKDWLNRIKIHLKALTNEGYSLDVWDDTRIKAGQKWEEEIEKALDEAAIAILIISADFLASDFIVENELPPLLVSAKEKGTKIIPIVASPCRFIQNKHLSIFQSINDPKEEILSDIIKTKQESIFVRLANVIEEYIDV